MIEMSENKNDDNSNSCSIFFVNEYIKYVYDFM